MASLWSRLRDAVSSRYALDLAFSDVLTPAADGVVYISRDIRAELRPGRYELRLQISTRDTTTATHTDITVLPRR